MVARLQIIGLVVFLMAMGLGAAAYKHIELGFPLFANAQQTIWKIETKIIFNAVGDNVTVRLNIPESDSGHRITLLKSLSSDYQFSLNDIDGTSFAQWTADEVNGSQALYLRINTYFDPAKMVPPPIFLANRHERYEGAALLAAKQLVLDASRFKTLNKRIQYLLAKANYAGSADMQLLLGGSGKRSDKINTVIKLLQMDGIQARSVRGLLLEENKRRQYALFFLEVFDGENWLLFDPREAALTSWQQVLILQRGDEALIEIFGGIDSHVIFSSIKEKRQAFNTAVDAAKLKANPLVDFSIYSLPYAEQNTFKLLLLIPLGALVVVLLRNLVGLTTSGTFMPILIALTFLQTELLTGLLLFVMVVGVGLIIRYYLSHLNLLLVPRIASVLVFVIIIYAALGISMHKMGIAWGAKVTFFPMIILAWTIERMSVLWEEEGGHEVFIQGGGSLITASLAYVVMSNKLVADTIFLYPELLLVVLAIIISIGSYSGYRLSDLRRFSAMDRY